MIKNRRFYLLQATTTPYRTELFNLIEEESKNTNIDLTIIYYKKMMADRDWVVDESKMTHKYIIYDCFEYFIKKYPFYFSYKIIRDFIRDPKAEIILGVSWNDFIVMTIITLKRLGIIKNKLHFWTEANYMDTGLMSNNSFKFKLRKFILDTDNGKIIIPGEIAKITVSKYWDIQKPFIYLPNTVNINYDDVIPIKTMGNKIKILIVARLEERVKGVLNFLKSINKDDFKQCEIYIAGEGSDRVLYEEYIASNGIENVKLLGNLDRDLLLSYYKGCDLFVLPSFSDSNPLSVIEALFAGKPLLISNQCGNKLEVINEGDNGYLMNPYEATDIKEKFHLIINRYKEFEEMGQKSFEIAKLNFEPKNIAKNFLESL